MADRAAYELKRAHDSATPDERAGKRLCADGGRTVFVDALNDIRDEITFAFKCIDRSAGEEASTIPIFSPHLAAGELMGG
jgi:hypothetical protein